MNVRGPVVVWVYNYAQRPDQSYGWHVSTKPNQLGLPH